MITKDWGSKSKRKRTLGQCGSYLRYVDKVPRRTNADLLKSMFDSYFHGS